MIDADRMALGMENALRDALGLGAVPYPDMTKAMKALAGAIRKEITDNAELNNAKFSGTFAGTVSGTNCSTTITNQSVSGGVK